MQTVITGKQDFGMADRKKAVREVWIDALVYPATGGNTQFTAEILADGVVKKTLSFDTAGVRVTRRFPLGVCRGFRFQMRFTQVIGDSIVYNHSFNNPAVSMTGGLVVALPRGAA